MNRLSESVFYRGFFGDISQMSLRKEGEEPFEVLSQKRTSNNKSYWINADFFLRYLNDHPKTQEFVVPRIGITSDPALTTNSPLLLTQKMGVSLTSYLESHPRGLSVEEMISISSQILTALYKMDELEIVYLDISTDNFLIQEGKIRLFNFNQAKFKISQEKLYGFSAHKYHSPAFLLGAESNLYRERNWILGLLLFKLIEPAFSGFPSKEENLAFFSAFLETPYPDAWIQNASANGKTAYEKSLEKPDLCKKTLKEIIEAYIAKEENGEDPILLDELTNLFNSLFSYENPKSLLELALSFPLLFQVSTWDIIQRNDQSYRDVSDFKLIGQGVFGSVFSCFSPSKQEHLAAKKELSGKASKIKHLYREDMVLRYLQASPSPSPYVLQHKKSFHTQQNLTIIFEKMKEDLDKYVKRCGRISLEQLRLFGRQLTEALDFLHHKKIVHLDIKPLNILLSSDEQKVVLADFGSASFEEKELQPQNFYQVTRWYRPPEMLLQIPYKTSCDLWSLGTTLAEVFAGAVLFRVGSEEQLFTAHRDRIEPYSQALLDKAPLRGLFKHGDSLANISCRHHRNLSDFLRQTVPNEAASNDELVEVERFLRRALQTDPALRPDPASLLEDPFLQLSASSETAST